MSVSHMLASSSRAVRRAACGGAALGVLLTGQALTGHSVVTAHADTTFDQYLFQDINQDRQQNGVAPLRWNDSLGSIGEAEPWGGCGFTTSGRAQDMLDRGYFSHTICGTHNVFDIMKSDNLPYGWAGENIGWESGLTDPQQAAQYLNQQFMNSTEHRDNILNPNFTDVGVGSAATGGTQTWSGGGSAQRNVFVTAEVFASLPASSTTTPRSGGTAPAQAPLPASHNGYWLAGGNGAVFDFAAPGNYGQESGHPLNQPVVGMAATPDGSGYWLVARDGGIFPHGNAAGYGSTGGIHLNQPIVGMASTASGQGYWLVASDGGIFPFGDAVGYGSTGGIHLNQPIVGMERTASGQGYWLVASDGGIFPFGDAAEHSYGSTGGMHLNRPIVGMSATPSGDGYWLVASDGGIFPFGDAQGLGSTGGMHLNRPIVGMSKTHSGSGYWLVASDGGIFPFGDAAGYGSTGGTTLNAPIVCMTIG